MCTGEDNLYYEADIGIGNVLRGNFLLKHGVTGQTEGTGGLKVF
jgi:hypothetical protein